MFSPTDRSIGVQGYGGYLSLSPLDASQSANHFAQNAVAEVQAPSKQQSSKISKHVGARTYS
eukprot:10917581-Heterocapsa_arctica.AAC.1